MIHLPELTADPVGNLRALQGLLDTAEPGTLELPPGEHRIAGGLRAPAGWTIRGAAAALEPPATWLTSVGGGGAPVVHVLGGRTAVSGLGLRPAPSDPGEHGGDRGTAITVGEYLYDAEPTWIEGVDVRQVRVIASGRTANAVALMGAVRDVTVHDVTVQGGHTGVAAHWGAVGAGVDTLVGPTYHPHRLAISDLRVSDAVEGFYLSSVYDVRVAGACLRDVEIGFRLLPGDNTDRFHRDPDVRIGENIKIQDVCVQWTGDRYGVRVAGWGRSEIDGLVSTLAYADTTIRDCVLRRVADAAAPTPRSWSPVLLERADGVALHGVRIESDRPGACCKLGPAG